MFEVLHQRAFSFFVFSRDDPTDKLLTKLNSESNHAGEAQQEDKSGESSIVPEARHDRRAEDLRRSGQDMEASAGVMYWLSYTAPYYATLREALLHYAVRTCGLSIAIGTTCLK